MKHLRWTKRRVIVWSVLSVILLGGVSGLAVFRACPKWQPAALDPPVTEMPESPFIDPDGMTQGTRILPPEGYERTPAADDSFLAFMRRQPLYEHGAAVCSYRGAPYSAHNAAAVYTLSVGREGYQECADSIIRLWSEYFYTTGQTDRIAFSLTNGYPTDYESWRSGKRILAFGNIAWGMKLAGYDDSVQQFHNYLMAVMHYAGTRSLEAESAPIAAEDARAGDLLVNGGSPGHAVLIADEAVNENGERVFLLANGFMPAQSAYILAGYNCDPNPWYTQEQLSADPVCLSTYTFEGTGVLRRHTGVGIN